MVQQDELVQSVLWMTGRFASQGADPNDVQRTLARISSWKDDWTREWSATAAMHEELAQEAERKGHTLTAGEAYLRAGVCYHWAKLQMAENPARYYEAHPKSVQTYWKGLRYVDPTAERLEIPFENITMAAHLRRPQGVERAPVVLLVGGVDAVKEEFYDLENHFLKRGMATLSLDGPGQGETREKMPVRADYEKAVTATLDFLASRQDLNMDAVGVMGVSRVGSYYAVRTACLEPRIKACVSVSGPGKRGGLKAWDQFISWSETPEESAAKFAQFSLEGMLSNIHCPVLNIHGEKDESAHAESQGAIEEIRAAGGQVEVVICKDGTHVCNNVPYRYKPLAADWMADHLRRP